MRTIILKPYGAGRYDDVSPFLITDNKLQLKIEIPAVNGEFYFIGKNAGSNIKRLIPADGVLMLENLVAGELCAKVKHYLKGELIKTYDIEPLLLKEADGSITAEPSFEALTRRVYALEGEEKKKDKIIIQYHGEIEKLNKTIEELTKFAEACIKASPYMRNYNLLEEINND